MATPVPRGPETLVVSGGRLPGARLRAGERVGRYVVDRLVGEGGMAQVYRAVDPTLRRSVALKVLETFDPRASARFLAEARAQAMLTHENVCRVWEAGDAGGIAYIAMQYVDGGTLESACGSLEWRPALALMADVAEAVHAAHRAGLIHRDVKPSNILLERSEDGRLRACVTDFGLVRELASPGLTVSGVVVGTPEYMAPEQARGESERVGRATDVWGLGATIHRVLAGDPPFTGRSPVEVMLRIAREEAPSLARLRPDLPRDVVTVVAKCLEREPEQRYDSARALAEDLRRVVDGDPILARPVPLAERGLRLVRRNRALAALAAAVLLLGAGLVGVSLGARGRERRRTALAQQLGRDAEAIEGRLRAARLLPLHDTARDKALVRERVAGIAAAARAYGRGAAGPSEYALGRAHLALGDVEAARAELDAAVRDGFTGPEVSLALGQALGEQYRAAREELARIPQKALREARRREIERTLRLPALDALRRARGAGTPRDYLEGLVALYARRYDQALRSAERALARDPGLWEAWRIVGDAWRFKAEAARDRGSDDEALAAYAKARAALANAAVIGRSDVAAHLGACQLEASALDLELRRGADAAAPFRAARTACAAARASDSEAVAPFTAEARLLARWAESRMLAGENPEEWVAASLALSAEAARRDPASPGPESSAGFAEQSRAEYALRRGEDPRPALARAIAHHRRASELDPSRPEAFSNLGIQHEILAEWQAGHGIDPRAELARAVAAYRQALSLKRDFVNAWINLGNAHRARGDWEAAHGADPDASYGAAIEAGLEATRRNAASPIAFNNLAIAYFGRAGWRFAHGGAPREDLAAAIAAARRAVAVNPRYAYGWTNLASMLALDAEAERLSGIDPSATLDEALACAERRLALDPGSPRGFSGLANVHVARARALLDAGRDPRPALAAGRAAAARARVLDPRHPESLMHEGELALVEARLPPAASEACRRGLAAVRAAEALDPDDPQLGLLEARLLLAQAATGRAPEGALDQALARASRALAVDPGLGEAHCVRGALLLRKARVARDRALLDEARTEVERGLAANRFLSRDWQAVLREARAGRV